MTDRLAALGVLAFEGDEQQREGALASFYLDWRHESLVINQWCQVQSSIPGIDALARVQALMQHQDFDFRNPNKVRALIGNFASNNPLNFHRRNGEGYKFLADMIAELDARNPSLASRLLNPLTKWRNYQGREQLMRAQLERLAAMSTLSPDVFEVVNKSLD